MTFSPRFLGIKFLLLFGCLCVLSYIFWLSKDKSHSEKVTLDLDNSLSNRLRNLFGSTKSSEPWIDNFNETICNSLRISQNSSLNVSSLNLYSSSKFPFTVPSHSQSLEELRLNPLISRGVYVYFLSKSQLIPDRFPKSFKSFYQFILKPFQYTYGVHPGHLDVIIFIERYPENVWELFFKQIGQNKTYNWIKIDKNHRIYPTFLKSQYNSQNEIEKTTMVYITEDSQNNSQPHRILIHLIGLNVPHYVADDAAVLDRDDWLKCAGAKWPLDYTLTNTLYTSLLLKHSLIQNYDYFIKIDTDISWLSQPPSDLIKDMANGSFLLFHSEIKSTGVDCESSQHATSKLLSVYREKILQKLTTHYAHHRCLLNSTDVYFVNLSRSIYTLINTLPLSQRHSWYNDLNSNQYFYGNFMGVWTGWALSEENQWLIDVLFDHIIDGYIKRRWGDQAIWGRLIGFWFNISQPRTEKQIYDLSFWRDKYFRHK